MRILSFAARAWIARGVTAWGCGFQGRGVARREGTSVGLGSPPCMRRGRLRSVASLRSDPGSRGPGTRSRRPEPPSRGPSALPADRNSGRRSGAGSRVPVYGRADRGTLRAPGCGFLSRRCSVARNSARGPPRNAPGSAVPDAVPPSRDRFGRSGIERRGTKRRARVLEADPMVPDHDARERSAGPRPGVRDREERAGSRGKTAASPGKGPRGPVIPGANLRARDRFRRRLHRLAARCAGTREAISVRGSVCRNAGSDRVLAFRVPDRSIPAFLRGLRVTPAGRIRAAEDGGATATRPPAGAR
jgi:hypothetical protein